MAAKRILLVEDEEDIAEILALVLRSEGYIVDTAGTLAQARQRLDAIRYTLVNTDLRLPDGNGLEIVHRAGRVDNDRERAKQRALHRTRATMRRWTGQAQTRRSGMSRYSISNSRRRVTPSLHDTGAGCDPPRVDVRHGVRGRGPEKKGDAAAMTVAAAKPQPTPSGTSDAAPWPTWREATAAAQRRSRPISTGKRKPKHCEDLSKKI
jgi:hypothetical protein